MKKVVIGKRKVEEAFSVAKLGYFEELIQTTKLQVQLSVSAVRKEALQQKEELAKDGYEENGAADFGF